jgi:hypothetical protein
MTVALRNTAGVAPRTVRRNSYPALMLFGVVYLAALAMVISPESFRSDRTAMPERATPFSLNQEGTP